MIYFILLIGAAMLGTLAMSLCAMAGAADRKIKQLWEKR